jgi:ATP-binding cassette subfamily B protein
MNDHGRIESFLTGSTLGTLFSLFNLIIFSVVLAIFNIYMFSVFVMGSILYSCWVMLFMKKRREFDQRRFEISSKEQSVLIQFILGMQEIKLNGVEKFMRFSWESLQARQFRLRMKSLSLNQWQQAGAFFINEGKNVLITFLAARAVIDGNMTLGEMLAAQYIIGQLSSPVNSLVGFMQSLQNAKISMERLNEIHTVADEEPEGEMFQQQLPASFMRNLAGGEAVDQALPEHPGALYSMLKPAFDFHLPVAGEVLEPGLAGNAIHFRNVSFTYTGAGNDPVLRNIDLTIPQGKTTAIVGTSGSGKTTVLKLLLKFYNPQAGGIYLNETPLSTISHKIWRSYCGAVMQDSFIFSGSIMANIAVGVKNVDMDRLWQAIDMANIRMFINDLPLGLNTKIGQEGSGISMGQKQRILIARAVYRNPSFLFFDEATNSLDANNESAIIKNMNTFFKGRTVVVIAHRLSTVKHADQIILLNRGMITERGTHQELVSLKGEYYTLVKNQLELDK